LSVKLYERHHSTETVTRPVVVDMKLTSLLGLTAVFDYSCYLLRLQRNPEVTANTVSWMTSSLDVRWDHSR